MSSGISPLDRAILEAAAELDPDTYVPILDALDADEEDLEDEEREPEPVEGGDDGPHGGLTITEYCPCCGGETGVEYWTT
jgi:hypothetical protein